MPVRVSDASDMGVMVTTLGVMPWLVSVPVLVTASAAVDFTLLWMLLESESFGDMTSRPELRSSTRLSMVPRVFRFSLMARAIVVTLTKTFSTASVECTPRAWTVLKVTCRALAYST